MSFIQNNFYNIIIGILIGVLGKYFADKFTDIRHKKEENCQDINLFNNLNKKLPDLFEEIKKDLIKNINTRDFVILNKNLLYNTTKDTFAYYFEEHNELLNKIKLMEDYGFVKITKHDSIILNGRFSDNFVQLLISFKK